MADETTTQETAKGDENANGKPSEDAAKVAAEAVADETKRVNDGKTDADIEAIAAKGENPDAVRKALTEERDAAKQARDEAKALADKVKEFEDRDKSEQQKMEERATTAEQKATDAEAKLLRYRVAAEKKLPSELADRLQGDTEKKLKEDADRLLELVKPDSTPAGDIDAGKGEGGGGNTFNDAIRAGI